MKKPQSYINHIGKVLLSLLLILVTTSSFTNLEENNIMKTSLILEEEPTLYEEMNLAKLGLKQNIFEKAITGWNTLKKKHLKITHILSIFDLSQSSNSKRLYIIDLKNKKVLFNTYVAHGRNSGEEFARSFSNTPNSYQSSLGFYITDVTYHGKHGLSLKLKGLEKEINHSAEDRNIVIHGADYVSESFIQNYGRLGRSLGCPAVPQELCEPIVNSIKEGTCFFMYYPDNSYFEKSDLL